MRQHHGSSRLGRGGSAQNAPLLLLSLLCFSHTFVPAAAVPYPKDDLHDAGVGFLMPRDCAQYCGYGNMYCCGANQQCYTANGIAGCKNTAAGGGYNLYTTTWTLTETFTSTFSSLFPAATTATTATCVPEEGTGQIACGNICCASWQYCAYAGQCSANPGAGGGYGGGDGGGGGGGGGYTVPATVTPTPTGGYITTYTSSGVVVTTTAFSAPYRVTGSGTTTGTAIGATDTSGLGGGSTTSSSSLSGGAIAGIVIGSLAGVALLIAICACVLVRSIWDGVMALLGLGGRRRRDSQDATFIEERRYSRHSTAGGRPQHSGWFGGRPPGPPPPPVSEKRKSSSGKWLGLGTAVATLLLLLGLRRHNRNDDRRTQTQSRSRHSSTMYSGSYTSTDPSSRDSRRTRGTRASRRTDATRISRSSRPSRQSRHTRQSRSASLR
ncbi:hypothetical protein SPI_07597 [Niveomyces insectorum RCEF 264]|uniref:Uncharacterized protein n=1 Tax=Niveomyces insectorum RCEF 264 TaxID=1081102 RepID=A0A167PES0_9HYPO|nr:hypothetical protein SPI_07597 [Niveomyces insectorum RCEF 264]